jgi:hypothetical protein
MEGYDLPGVTQVEDYRKSVHYQSLTIDGNLSAPTCVTCHGSHGATPPGVRSVAEVCGICHNHNRELFMRSAHQEVFESMEVAGCLQCHGNHAITRTDEQMLVGSESVCMVCHSEGDAGGQRADAMASRIRELDAEINLASETLDQAEQAGIDVSAAAAELTSAHSHLVMSRTAVHSLELSQVNAEIEQGIPIAQKVAQEGRDRLAEIQSRRRGVALFALLVLVIVATLYFYIRQEDKFGKSRS